MPGERRRRWPIAAGAGLLVMATAAVAGCGGATRPGAAGHGHAVGRAGQRVTITGTSALRFRPSVIHVHTGKVRITLRDSGSYPHNIVIPALGVTSRTVTGDPGDTRVSFTVTFRHPGRYPFHCQYHASAGMAGTFVVG
jgi:plastocyanin